MAAHPKEYKVAAKAGGGKLEIQTRPWKDPSGDEVTIKVLACGVCHSDHMTVDGLGQTDVPGHEVVGDVVAVGPVAAKSWKPGQRVGVGWHGGNCFECGRCRQGEYSTCHKLQITGVTREGGYAEYLTVPESGVVNVPKDLDPAEAAPLLCAGLTAFNSIRHMGTEAGSLVAIQGIGGVGSYAVQFSSKMGYVTAALSSSASKEKLAEELGAHHYIDASKGDVSEALQKLGGANLIVATAPADDPGTLINGLKQDGTFLILGITEKVTASPLTLVQKRLSVRGWPSGTPSDSEDTLAFASKFGIKSLVQKYPFEKAAEAYADMMAGKPRFRAVIVFS